MKLAYINLSLFIVILSFFFLIICMPSGQAQSNKQTTHKNVFAKEKIIYNNRKEFTEEKNLVHLMELVKEAGITQKDLAKWDLESTKDRQKLLQYLQKIQADKIEEQRRIKVFLSKNFRTIMDIWKNMQESEDQTLIKMSEKLIDEDS